MCLGPGRVRGQIVVEFRRERLELGQPAAGDEREVVVLVKWAQLPMYPFLTQ